MARVPSSTGRRGRPPALAPRGRLLGAAATSFIALGLVADRVDLIGLGIALVAFLFVILIGQYPAAIFIWRRYVELAWRVERPSGDPALYAGRPLSLAIEIRNKAPRMLGIAQLRILASPGLDIDATHLIVPRETESRATLVFTPRSVGLAMLHGVALRLSDPLGLTEIEAYFPSPIALPILPRLGAPLAPEGVPLAHGPERAQRSAARLAGQGGDLRELRDHRPGDPWKQIAWKATARRGRLMVRELERETQSRHLVVLDVSGRMREGHAGGSALDGAIELTARYVRGALDAGDQAGLITVDARVVAALPPSDRAGQRRRLTEILAVAPAVYDEDLTDLSDAELCATVGRYLLLQEGEETRVAPPPVDDPRWSRLIAAPTGELYELSRLTAAMRLARERSKVGGGFARLAALPLASDPQMAELRGFCRERAIPLPPRFEPGRGLRGIAAALTCLRTGRLPDRLVILSLFDGLELLDGPLGRELLPDLVSSMNRLKRRGARMLLVAPLIETVTASVDPIDELLALDRKYREARLGDLARRLGVPIRICRDPASFRIARSSSTARMGRAA